MVIVVPIATNNYHARGHSKECLIAQTITNFMLLSVIRGRMDFVEFQPMKRLQITVTEWPVHCKHFMRLLEIARSKSQKGKRDA